MNLISFESKLIFKMKKIVALALVFSMFVLTNCSKESGTAPDPLSQWYGTWTGTLQYSYNTNCGLPNNVQTFAEQFLLVIKSTIYTGQVNMVCSYFNTFNTVTGNIAVMSSTPDLRGGSRTIGFPNGKFEIINGKLSVNFTAYTGSCNGFAITPPYTGLLTKQ